MESRRVPGAEGLLSPVATHTTTDSAPVSLGLRENAAQFGLLIVHVGRDRRDPPDRNASPIVGIRIKEGRHGHDLSG